MFSDLRKGAAFLEGSRGSPVCPPGNSNMHMRMSVAHWRSDTNMRKPKHSEKTPVPMPLYPPQISQGLAWDRNRASTVTGDVCLPRSKHISSQLYL